MTSVNANGKPMPADLPCMLEDFLKQLGLPPKSVVVEHNGEAVAPSEFSHRVIEDKDSLEIVRIVAGG